MADHDVGRCRGDEADVGGAGCVVCAGGPASRVGIDRADVELLAAELECGAFVGAELLALHAEHALVPGGGDLDVLHVEHDVVDAVDGEAHGCQAWVRFPVALAERRLATTLGSIKMSLSWCSRSAGFDGSQTTSSSSPPIAFT